MGDLFGGFCWEEEEGGSMDEKEGDGDERWRGEWPGDRSIVIAELKFCGKLGLGFYQKGLDLGEKRDLEKMEERFVVV